MSAITVSIAGVAAGATEYGSVTIGPIYVAGSIAPLQQTMNLASGNNTITPPSSAVGVIITPPLTNTIVLKYKTTSGDTGLNIRPASPSIFIFDPANPPTSLFVNAASATTGLTQFTFF